MTIFYFRNQVCKQFISQEQITIEAKTESCSDLTTIIETTTVPVGLDIPNGMADSKINPHSHTMRIGMSYQPPTLRQTDSQSMSIQTHDLTEYNDLCPTATKTNFKEKEMNAEISQPAKFRYYFENIFDLELY